MRKSEFSLLVHLPREEPMRMVRRQEGRLSTSQEERGFTRNPIAWHLDLDFPSLWSEEKYISVV